MVFSQKWAIFDFDMTKIPGATKLLTRLSLVSPVSVFGCLGDQATPIRDVFVRRLCSRVEVRIHSNPVYSYHYVHSHRL